MPLIIGSIVIASPVVTAASPLPKQSSQCENDSYQPAQSLPEFNTENISNTEISADYTRTDSEGKTYLDGNVVIEQHKLRVKADQAHYSQQQDTLTFSGNVHIDTESLSLDADKGTINMSSASAEGKDVQGEFENIHFYIPDSNMKGSADSIHGRENSETGRQNSILENASVTSCNLLDPDWLISADEISLDHVDEYGSADDVVIRFKDVPFLYTPYIEFPTSDRRRSGLLFPEFGASSSRGAELAVPLYWNIAPEMDAVIAPRYMEKRGLELGGNYRYLTRSTSGELKGAWLHEDDITDEERYQVRYQQHTRFTRNLLLDIDLQDISDRDYFNDFTNSLGSTSQTHLFRTAKMRYNLGNWQLNGLVQDIKTINDLTPVANRPYERLPKITFNGNESISDTALKFGFNSEFVDFTHEDDTKTTGQRVTLQPEFSLPLTGVAWFFKPSVKFSHTQYSVGVDATGMDTDVENISVPVSSIDTGLFFERNLDSGLQQTLEPRLYYLNVPFEDQSGIPVFDTRLPDFTFSQLFRDNRFVGGDRFGDANQLSLAITSRILDPVAGKELIRASIGQIFYFEDRKVSLDNTIDTSRQSDVVAELQTNWNRWQGNFDIQWDTNDSKLAQEYYSVNYTASNRNLLNLGYRKRNNGDANDIEQTDTSFVYALNTKYTAYARWNYSLKDNKDIDTIAGLAYDSCCWSLQILGQRRLQNTNNTSTSEYDNAVLIQFVFKGLGSLSGNKTRTTLEQSIYGYTDVLQ